MTTSKLKRLPRMPGKRYITTSLRVTKEENDMHREAALKAGMTFSAWATIALNRVAQRTLNPKEKNGTPIQ